jgi:hypothetical protein
MRSSSTKYAIQHYSVVAGAIRYQWRALGVVVNVGFKLEFVKV